MLTSSFSRAFWVTEKFPLHRVQHDRPIFHALLSRFPSWEGGVFLLRLMPPGEGLIRVAQFELPKLETAADSG